MSRATIGLLFIVAACYPGGRYFRPADSFGHLPIHPDTGEPAIASFYCMTGLRELPEGAESLRLITAIWEDGTLCWSHDRTNGGRPYSTTRVSAERAAAAVDALEAALDRPSDYYIFDADHQVIAWRSAEGFFAAWSSIDLFESDSRLVATDHGGVEALNGRDRTEALRAASEEHRALRTHWAVARQILADLLPASGEPLSTSSFDWACWDGGEGRGQTVPGAH